MSRLHVHLHVQDLDRSIRFYATLFGAEPTRREADYAKWMLEHPPVNFAISVGGTPGISHLGIQVDSDEELAIVSKRANEAAGAILIEQGARCCYAIGNKGWIADPQGIRWEMFHTTGTLNERGQDVDQGLTVGDDSEHQGCRCGAGKQSSQTATCCS